MDVSNSSNVAFHGLTITSSRGVGLLAKNVTGLHLSSLTVSNHGTTGIDIDGHSYVLEASTVQDTGCVGVRATGGDVATLTPGSNLLLGNTIRRPALWKRTYMAGLLWGGVNNSFVNNSVSDGPHNCERAAAAVRASWQL